MAGKVQMIYIDPPYGIKYGSNVQPFVNRRDVKDGKDEDLMQEPEMIKAFLGYVGTRDSFVSLVSAGSAAAGAGTADRERECVCADKR